MQAFLVDDVDRIYGEIARLGLMSGEELSSALSSAPPRCRTSIPLFLAYLVRVGWLSKFQADRIQEGVGKRLVLGPYQLLAPLGRGGSGMVYLARDRRSDGPVALKLLPPSRYRREERQLKRFLREMAMSAKVDHPHIARRYDSGVIDEVYFIALEFVPGCNLRQRVISNGPLSVGQAAQYFSEVADALHHIHQRGLVHRDLKPGNMMVTPNEHAKLLDLGFALVAGETSPEDRSIIGGPGYVVGTMDFVSPEQVVDGTKVDGRADLYSLGCSLYFTLTGLVPFPGGSSKEKVLRHRRHRPEPISKLNPRVPTDFVDLIEQLMAKQPQARPASADLVRQSLLRWAREGAVRPMDVVRQPHRFRDPIDVEEANGP